MKRTKKIALIMLAVALMAVCFVFCASAETWGDYEYTVLEDGTVEITDYTGNDIELIIPSEISGKVVTSIDSSALHDCYSFVNVIIPDSIKYIGSGAFVNCINLKSITIGKNVEYIDASVFFACTSLEKIVVDEKNMIYSSDVDGVLFDKNKTELIRYPQARGDASYIVPESVERISGLAFEKALNLENLVITENVRTIGEYAFQECFSLTNVTISTGIESIDSYAIVETPFLEKFVVKDMDVKIGEYSLGVSAIVVRDMNKKEFRDLVFGCYTGKIPFEELEEQIYYLDEIVSTGTIYCHAGSTAEAYAIENGVKYELTHFFEGEWTYDYDNMIRTRKCIHCDELQVEELEIEEISGENFLLVEEKVVNGIGGNVEVLKAFDINLKNSEGVHVQPDGTVKVKLPNDWSKKGVYKVYRVNDDGTLTDMNAYRQGSHLVFDTDHFSIYVIVFTPDETTEEEPETPDTPAEPDTSGCMCLCHKTDVFSELLMSIFRFLTKLLGVFPVCQCGVAHY